MFENLAGILTAAALAGLVGLEREMQLQKKGVAGFGGFRTFAMAGALGFLSGFLQEHVPGILLAVFCVTFAFSLVSHAFNAFAEKKYGLTSEFAVIAGFLIGALVFAKHIVFATFTAIIFSTLLAFKDLLHKIARNFHKEEFLAILKFLIIAGVILPLLPDAPLDDWGIFNPRKIWLMIVLVASIRFVGFFLAKIFGQSKSVILLGVFGGLASSTAVTNSLSCQSKKSKVIAPFAAGILLANAVMFLRVFLEAEIVFPSLGKSIALPLFLMMAAAVLLSLAAMLRSKEKAGHKEVSQSSPFSFSESLKFGFFFLLVLASAKILPEFFGDLGLFATAAVSGLADVDAITLSVASLAKVGEISFQTASAAIFIAVAVNTVVKVAIVAIFSNRKMTQLCLASFTLVMAAGLAGLIFSS